MISGFTTSMKQWLVGICLLSVGIAAAESVTVSTQKPLLSSRQPKVSVVLNGEPVVGAKVDFCKVLQNQCSSLITNDYGIAIPPALAAGTYEVSVTTDDYAAYLDLKISRKAGITPFPVDLTGSFNEVQAAFIAAKEMPVNDRVQAFRGLLQDPTESPIPGATIKVIRRGTDGNTVILRLKSDSQGRFLAPLPLEDGFYVAFFSAPGFRNQIVPFEFQPKEKKKWRSSCGLA